MINSLIAIHMSKFLTESPDKKHNKLITEVCKAAEAGTLAFFVGAGISKPSRLPTSADIIDLCVEQLINDIPSELSCCQLFPKNFGTKLRLEYFCQSLAEINDTIGLLPLQFLSGGTPSGLHYFIAACTKCGYATTIVTTNFDILIERAFDELGIPYRILYSEDDFAGFSLDTKGVTLIKIHGTLDQQSYKPLPGILADVRSVGKGLSEGRRRVLQSIVEKYNLLFLGYSGRDYFGAMTTFFSCKPLPMYWINHASSGNHTNEVVKKWVLKNGGLYIDANTENVVAAIQSKLALEVPNHQEADINHIFNFADRLSLLERSFALAYLYSRDYRSDKNIVYNSFKECNDIFSKERDVDPVLHCKLILQWVRTLERFGRTPDVYSEAIRLLRSAETLVAKDEPIAVDVKVALCDMNYSLTYTLGGSGIEYLPLIEMLIDQCLLYDDPVMLSRAYCVKAKIYQNSFEPKISGYPMALDSYNLAIENLEPRGVYDILPILQLERFKLASALSRGDEAKKAIISCLRGALLLADRPDSDWVLGILNLIYRYLSDERYKKEEEWMKSELKLLGLELNPGYSEFLLERSDHPNI